MKAKAVIFRPNRRNDVVKIGNKQLSGRVFHRRGSTYFFDPNAYQLTRGSGAYRWIWYVTNYFIEGFPNPIPLHDIEAMYHGKSKLTVVGEDKKGGKVANEFEVVNYKKFINLGPTGQQINKAFTPWFFEVIANSKKDPLLLVTFYMLVGTLVGVGILVFKALTGEGASP